MHKSKLSGFIIDCRTNDLEAAAAFWSRALGMPVHELPGSENDSYRGLTDAQHGLDIEVQTVDHPSRVHLDIETDDIDAELPVQPAKKAKVLEEKLKREKVRTRALVGVTATLAIA